MTRVVQFKPEPDIYEWLNRKAMNEYRSVPSVIKQILAEKHDEEVKSGNNKSIHSMMESAQ